MAINDQYSLYFTVIRGWLVRRCSGDIGLLNATNKHEGAKVFLFTKYLFS